MKKQQQLVVKKIENARISKFMENELTSKTVNQIVNLWDIKVDKDEIIYPKGKIDQPVIETLILRYPRMFTFIRESEFLKEETKELLIKRVEEIMGFLIKELRKEDIEYSNEKFLESIKWF